MKIALVKYGNASYIACTTKNLSKVIGREADAELVDLFEIDAVDGDVDTIMVETSKLFKQLAVKKLEAALSFAAQFAGPALLGRAADLRESIDGALALAMARFIP